MTVADGGAWLLRDARARSRRWLHLWSKTPKSRGFPKWYGGFIREHLIKMEMNGDRIGYG